MGTLLVCLQFPPVLGQEPPPPDELMQPTHHGVRLTPDIARGLSRLWLGDTAGSMTEDQRSRLVDALGAQIMDTGRKNGAELASYLQFMAEFQMASFGMASPTYSKKFAERSREMMPLMREFCKQVPEIARPILDERQMGALQARLQLETRGFKQFERKLKRWADGKADQWESPWLPHPKDMAKSDEDKTTSTIVVEAEQWAEDMFRWIGPERWGQFLTGARFFFDLDEDQMTRGERILEAYRAKARTIMTDEWQNQVGKNRMQYYVSWRIREEMPIRPWQFRLVREYREMVRPITTMGRAYRGEILALLTDEQRAATVVRMRRLAENHGLPFSAEDPKLLGLTAQSRPAPE